MKRFASVVCVVCAMRFAAAREVASFAAPPGATNAVAVLGDGSILLAGDTVAALDPVTGATRWSHPLDDPATCAVALSGGRFATATRRGVRVHAADGAVEDPWALLSEQAWITSLAVGSNTVFVCDAGQRVVWRYTLDGRLIDRLPPAADAAATNRFTVPSPYFDAVFSDGSFWIANSGAHEIRRYSPEGTRLATWGHASMADPAGFVGCCNPIHLAVLPDGTFATAEKGIARVKLHGSDGRLLRVVAGADAFARGRVVRDLAADARGRVLVLDGDRLRVFEIPPG